MRIFIELYNWKSDGQVYEIHRIVKLEKMGTSKAKHSYNLGGHYIVEISSILYSIHIVFKDQEKIVFYINNYIN